MAINKAHATRPMRANGVSRPIKIVVREGRILSGGDPARMVKWPSRVRLIEATGEVRRRLNRQMVKSGTYCDDYGRKKRGVTII